MRENRRNITPPLVRNPQRVSIKSCTELQEEDKAWEDFLRTMGADIGASRSDLRGIFENHARLRVCRTLPRRTCESFCIHILNG